MQRLPILAGTVSVLRVSYQSWKRSELMFLATSLQVGHMVNPVPLLPGTQVLPHNAVHGSPVTIARVTASVPPIT